MDTCNPSHDALLERIAQLEGRLEQCEKSRALLTAALAEAQTTARLTQAELRRQRRLVKIYEQLPAGVYFSSFGRTDSDFFISRQVERIIGVPADEWAADPRLWASLLHPDDRERVLHDVAEAWDTGQHLRLEYRIRHREGRWIWIYEEATIVPADEDGPRRFQGFYFDVTARKTAEAAIRAQEAMYRSLAENIPDVIARVDREGHAVYVSPHAHYADPAARPDGYGLSPQTAAEMFPGLARVVEAAFATGAPQIFEYTVDLPAGARSFEARLVPEARPEGAVETVLIISRDVTEQRRADAVLRESEARLRLALDAASMVAWEWDPATDHTIWIGDPDRALGTHNLGDASFSTLSRIVPTQDIPLIEERLLAAMSTGELRLVHRYYRHDGTAGWIESYGHVVQREAGGPRLLVGVTRDITQRREAQEAIERLNSDLERRVQERTSELEQMNTALRHEIAERERAEAALRESQRFQELVLAAFPAQLYVFDYRGKEIIYTNKSLVTALGYPPETQDSLGHYPLEELMHPEDKARLPSIYARYDVLDDEGVVENEFRLRQPDGRWRWFTSRDIVLVRGEDGRPRQMLGAVLDITGRKRVEVELVEAFQQLDTLNTELGRSDNLLRTIINGLEDGLALIGNDGRVLMLNRAMTAICRVDTFKILGRQWAEVCPFETPLIDRALREGLTFSGREHIVRDGLSRVLDIQAIPLALAGGGRQVVLHLVDVTERLQFEDLALRNERLAAMGRLAAIVAHEVNSPLQAIQNFLFLIANDDPAEREGYLAVIAEEIDRIGGLIRRLLDLQRPGDDVLRVLDVRTLIEKVLTITSSTMARHRVSVERDLAAEPALVEGRGDQLTQVLLNLILNALDTMPHGGELQIRLRRRPYEATDELVAPTPPLVVAIEVADSGEGISSELLTRIFEPFFTTKSSGSGLGLSISRQIIEQHKGRLTARNRAPHGAVFVIVLPAVKPGPST